MRDLKRNQQAFYYALYQGKEDVVDSNGLKTGEKKISYGNPVKMKANISPVTGYVSDNIFGKDLQYDMTMVTCDIDCPIDEFSVLWIGIEPFDADGNQVAYNYTVTKVARGLYNLLFALSKVEAKRG